MIPRDPTLDTPISVDSCLTGGGGHFGNRIYFTAYPEFILQQALNISELEMLNTLIAIKLWAPMLPNHVVRLQCDNLAAVLVLQLGRGRASFLLSCVRVVGAYTAQYKFEFRVEHIHKTLWPTRSAAITVTRPAAPGLTSLLPPQIPTAPCGHISIQIIPTFSGFIILSYSLNLFAMSMILIDILSDILLCLFILLWIYLRSGVPQGSAYPMPTALAPKQTSDRRSNRTQIFASPMV